jgi:hypothetical protein
MENSGMREAPGIWEWLVWGEHVDWESSLERGCREMGYPVQKQIRLRLVLEFKFVVP